MTILNFKREQAKTTEIKMPNNLETMIRRSGLLNKEVAERKGIRPETVSRHISGALQFTLKDAEEYAMILDCTAQDILFVQKATQLFGYLNNENVEIILPVEKERAFYLPYPTEDTRRIVIARHTNNAKKWANDRMYMFDSSPINKGEVAQECYMNLSIFLVEGNKLPQFGVVYPEPGGTFSIGFNTDSHTNLDQSVKPGAEINETRTGLNLVWSCPIVGCIFRPDLVGVIEKKF